MTAHLIFSGEIEYDFFVSTGNGDPQFAGFQGQKFQVHGIPDEHFALISTPEFFVNSKFVYISNGVCTYTETECFSHPGTYLGQLFFGLAGGVGVKVVSGAHSAGLQVFLNDRPVRVGERLLLGSSNSSYVHVKAFNQVSVGLGLFTIGATNSDHFLNIQATVNNPEMLRLGAQHITLKTDDVNAIQTSIETTYGAINVHGLLGQTIRDIEYAHHALIQGDSADYQVSSLSSPDFVFSQFQA